MKRAFVATLLLCGLARGAAGANPVPAPVPPPLPLAHPPPITNPSSSALFDALLAISRAQQTNPQAAQTAGFMYEQAIQQYRSGNLSAARRTAIEASATAGQPPAFNPQPPPAPVLPAARPQIPGTEGGLYGADAPEIDADTFLALARGTIDDCASRHDRNVAPARQHYALAADAFAAGNWQTTRREAKAAIDACARPR